MNKSNIIDIEAHQPHEVAELICLACHKRWIGVYPAATLLKDIQCPNCKAPGTVIKTGQTLEQE